MEKAFRLCGSVRRWKMSWENFKEVDLVHRRSRALFGYFGLRASLQMRKAMALCRSLTGPWRPAEKTEKTTFASSAESVPRERERKAFVPGRGVIERNWSHG